MSTPWFDPLYDESENSLLVQAASLMNIGRFADSLHYVNTVLSQEEMSFRAWALKGEILRQARRPQEAAVAFERAIELDGSHDWVLGRLSETYRDLGELPQALHYLDLALELNPESVFALAVKGEILRSTGQPREALDFLERSLQLNIERATSYAQRAEELRQSQHHEESLHYYDSALTASSHSSWTLASKGEALRTLGEFEAALEAIDQALQLSQRHLALLGSKAEMLRKVGRFEDALASFDRALEIHVEKARMLSAKAMVLGDLGQFDEADALLEQAISLQPEAAYLWWNRGELLDRVERYDAARPCLERVIELDPSHAEAVATYARILCIQGDFPAARRVSERYRTLRVDDWGHFLSGVISLYMGMADAKRELVAAVTAGEERLRLAESRGMQTWRTFNLALFCLAAGQHQRAETLYAQALPGAHRRQLLEARHDLNFVRGCLPAHAPVDTILQGIEEALER